MEDNRSVTCAGYSGHSLDNRCTHPPRFKIAWPFTPSPFIYSCGQHVGWALLSYGPEALAVIEWID